MTLLAVGGRIAAIEVVTPANVPGPPPHDYEDAEARVITCFEPQGFETFFLEYSVDVDEAGAFETLVSEAMITRVIEGCAQFGMILTPT